MSASQTAASNQNTAVYENGSVRVECGLPDGNYTLSVTDSKNGWVEAIQSETAAGGRLAADISTGALNGSDYAVKIYNMRGELVITMQVVFVSTPSLRPSPPPVSSPAPTGNTASPSPTNQPSPTISPGGSASPSPSNNGRYPFQASSPKPPQASVGSAAGRGVKAVTAPEVLKQLENKARNIEFSLGSDDIIALDEDALRALCGADRGLLLRKGIVTVIIPARILKELSVCSASYFEIHITPAVIKPPNVSYYSLNEELLKNSYDIAVYVDSVRHLIFNGPVTVRYDLSGFRITEAEKKKLTGILSEKGVISQLGGEYTGTVLSIYTSRLGLTGVLLSDTAIKITVAVGSRTFYVNGAPKLSDVAPVIVDDRVMVPVRFIAEALGAEVLWLEAERAVNIKLDALILNLETGKIYEGMDVPTVIMDDRTMVPLRFVSEKLGCNVVWNDAMKTVVIYR